METSARIHVTLLAMLLASLVPCDSAQSQVLYRCALADRPPAWQDRPCPAGAQQSELAFEPAAVADSTAAAPAPLRGVRGDAAQAPSRRARPPARRIDAGADSTACVQARRVARLRIDADGKRLPVRTIRANERRMREACGPRR